jgi:hypothetical protein
MSVGGVCYTSCGGQLRNMGLSADLADLLELRCSHKQAHAHAHATINLKGRGEKQVKKAIQAGPLPMHASMRALQGRSAPALGALAGYSAPWVTQPTAHCSRLTAAASG